MKINKCATILAILATCSLALAGDLTVDKLTVMDGAEFYGDIKTGSPDGGLGLHFSFDSDAKPTPDDSGNGYQGTVNGATWTSESHSGHAYDFDGADDYIETTGNLGITGGEPWTASCWIKYGTLHMFNNNENIISFGQWGPSCQSMNIGHGNYPNTICLMAWGSYNESDIDCGVDLTANMVHIVATYDGTDAKLYANGILRKTKNIPYNLADAPVRIGGKTAGYEGRYFDGIIDDVKIFSCALTSNQVFSLYQTGHTPGGSWSIKQSAPVTNVLMGRVGIGTADPASTLHVIGEAKIEGPLDMGGNRISNVADPAALTDAVNYQSMAGFVSTNAGGTPFAQLRQDPVTLAVTENFTARALGSRSHAEGENTDASGADSHAEGIFTVVAGLAGHAEGGGTRAVGAFSHAGGLMGSAMHDNSFVWSSSDDQYREVSSTAPRQFTVYAVGGIRLLGGLVEGEFANTADIPMGVYTNR